MSEDLKNQLQKKTEEKKETIEDWILSKKDKLEKALPSIITIDRMVSIAMTTLQNNKKLQACIKSSLLAGLVTAAQLGLEINTPLNQAYLIPYKNKKDGKTISEAQFQVGYQGLIELALRTNQYTELYAVKVFENDEFQIEYGLNRNLIHKPATGDRGKVVGYYGVYKLINGGFHFIHMTKEEVETFAKDKSIPYKNGYSTPWKTDFDAMALKTVLKKLLKYAPKTTELVNAMVADGTIKNDINERMDLVEDEAGYEAEMLDDDMPPIVE